MKEVPDEIRSTVPMMLAPGWRKDMHRDTGMAIIVGGGPNVLHRILDVSDVGKLDCRAIVVANDQRLVVLSFQNLVVRQYVCSMYCHPIICPFG